MAGTDMRQAVADLRAALGLLTRIPVTAAATGPRGAWAWPIAGAVVGALAWVALAINLSPGVSAALTLGVSAVLTGAMHEDGLADSADGLWGGQDRERRLEIMKDSRIGTYGVLALIIVTLGRWSALAMLFASGQAMTVLIGTGLLSRAPMAAIQAILPNARGSGLSEMTGRPPLATALSGAGLAVVLALPFLGLFGTLAAAIGVLFAGLATMAVAKAKIGGQTGDILGAAQQLSDLAALALLTCIV
jgi:adenosylcobinamide-GDP ribazoletransferase